MSETKWQACKSPARMLRYLEGRTSERKLRLFACACCRRLWPWLTGEGSRQAIEVLERQADGPVPTREWEVARAAAAAEVRLAEEARQGRDQAMREAEAQRAQVWQALWVGDPPAPGLLVRSAAESLAARAAADEPQVAQRAAQLVLDLLDKERNPSQAADEAVQIVTLARSVAASQLRSMRWLQHAGEEEDRPVSRARAAVRASQAVHWVETEEEKADERSWRRDQLAEKSERRAQCDLLRDLVPNPFRSPPAFDPAWLTWNDGAVSKMAQTIYAERRFADLPILADALEEAGCDEADILSHCRGGGPHARGCWVIDLLRSVG
jgi:hypothetical protein